MPVSDLPTEPSVAVGSDLSRATNKEPSTRSSTRSNSKLTRQTTFSLPPGTPRIRLHTLLKGRLSFVVGILILLSTTLTFVELQVYGCETAPEPGEALAPPEHSLFFEASMHAFTIFFLLELLLRLYVYQMDFFRSFFNLMDAIIVVLACVDAWVLHYVQADFLNMTFIRLLRFVRIARALRVMRTLSLFQNLRVLLNTIYMSLTSLFWSMLVLFVFMLASSLFLSQMLQDFIRNEQAEYSTRVWVARYYGTSARALWTMFELTLSGCWPEFARTIIEKVHPGYAVFFSLYVTGVVFAMIRIISALFLKDTLTSTANDDELMCSERSKEINAFKAKLAALFNDADHSEDGYLDRTELEWLLEHPNVKVWMSALGLDVRNAMELFELLDDGDGYVSQFEFLDGITRLRGSARSQDLFILMRTTQSILDQCDSLRSSNQSLHAALGVPPPQSPPQRLRFGACGTPSLSKPTAAQGP